MTAKCRKINGIHKYKTKQHPNAFNKGYCLKIVILLAILALLVPKYIKTTHLVPGYLLKICGKFNPPTGYAFRYLMLTPTPDRRRIGIMKV